MSHEYPEDDAPTVPETAVEDVCDIPPAPPQPQVLYQTADGLRTTAPQTPPPLPPYSQYPQYPQYPAYGAGPQMPPPSAIPCTSDDSHPRLVRNYGCLGCGSMLVLCFGLFAFLAYTAASSSSVTRKTLSGDVFAQDAVAVIRVEGTLMSDRGFILEQINDVKENDRVRAVVLRINSPGGTVSASDFYYHELTRLREEADIPIVVSMGGLCASGGYYVAMSVGNEAQRVIFAEPTTWTGSIGVVISRYDLTALGEKIGVKEDPIKSHELKGMGSVLRPLTDEERILLEDLVLDAFERFKEVVRSGRKRFDEKPELLDVYATGQVFTTRDAIAAGLVDETGYLQDAIDRACRLVGVDQDEAYVYTYEPVAGLGSLLSATSERMEERPLDILDDLATPQALYMWKVGR